MELDLSSLDLGVKWAGRKKRSLRPQRQFVSVQWVGKKKRSRQGRRGPTLHGQKLNSSQVVGVSSLHLLASAASFVSEGTSLHLLATTASLVSEGSLSLDNLRL